ncbi:hypothetical protein HOC80_01165 [archaeon]|jgi:hypothetical protein|nr:hypothetical protein [archaeon]MBT4416693.1 hypothetical protein [archaeon]
MTPISKSTKKHIKVIADFLREKYETEQGMDWERLAEDLGIDLVKDPRVIKAYAYTIKKDENTHQFALVPAWDFYGNLEGTIAHEIGHHVLGHLTTRKMAYIKAEAETDYLGYLIFGEERETELTRLKILTYTNDPNIRKFADRRDEKGCREYLKMIYGQIIEERMVA